MIVEHKILELYGIGNVKNEPGLMLLQFITGELILPTHIVEGLVLWMRANTHNGGYYSLELGNVVIAAARPYKNRHVNHKERLASKLSRFKPWFAINKKLKTCPNEHHFGGYLWFEDVPSLRLSRLRNKDYILEVSKFVPYTLGK